MSDVIDVAGEPEEFRGQTKSFHFLTGLTATSRPHHL
jgi:hypothetical protein